MSVGLENAKIGDIIGIQSRNSNDWFATKVDKVTDKFIDVGTTRFNKTTGRETGTDTWRRSYIAALDHKIYGRETVREKIEKDAAKRKVRAAYLKFKRMLDDTEWDKFSPDQLEKIQNYIESVVGENNENETMPLSAM